jgi:hypothetical protein
MPETSAERRKHPRVIAQVAVRSRPMEPGEMGLLLGSLGDSDPKLPALGLKKSKSKSGAFEMVSTTLSVGGLSATGDLQVLGDKTLAKGEDLMVEMDLNDGQEPLRAVAQVMWTTAAEGGKSLAGLMFVIISEDNLQRIHKQVTEAVAQGKAAP